MAWKFGLQASHEVVVGLLGVIQTAGVVDGNVLTLLRVVNTVALDQSLLFDAHDVIEMCVQEKDERCEEKKQKGRRGKLGRGRLSTFFSWAGHDVMNLKCL